MIYSVVYCTLKEKKHNKIKNKNNKYRYYKNCIFFIFEKRTYLTFEKMQCNNYNKFKPSEKKRNITSVHVYFGIRHVVVIKLRNAARAEKLQNTATISYIMRLVMINNFAVSHIIINNMISFEISSSTAYSTRPRENDRYNENANWSRKQTKWKTARP
jgi:hypothetical protein